VAQYNWRPFEEAREFARGLGLRSLEQWQGWAKSGQKPADIPSNPHVTAAYRGKWQGWSDWLGTPKRHEWRPFEEAREYVHSLDLKSQIEYKEWSKSGKRPLDIPGQPNTVYEEFAGYQDWLGTGVLPFEDAREIARGLGLKTRREWTQWWRSNGPWVSRA
jgi:hypothetical protein